MEGIVVNWQFYTLVIFSLLLIFEIILIWQIKRVKDNVPKQVEAQIADRTDLSRDMTLLDITMLGIGAMIGAGIFVLTGIAAGIAGPGLILAFVLNGFFALLTGVIYAELGSAIPEAGGGFLWVKSAMGNFQSFLSGWMSWFGHIVAGSLYALGFGSYFTLLISEFNLIEYHPEAPDYFFSIDFRLYQWDFGYEKLFGIIVICIFLYINYLGSSETGGVGNVITMTKIIIIGVFIISGLVFALQRPISSFSRLEPVVPTELIQEYPNLLGGEFMPIFIAMGFTFIAFEGYEIIVQSGEEVQNPNINVPKAIFYALMVVVPIYVLVGFVALTSIRPEGNTAIYQFLGNVGELGLAEAARQFMPFGVVLILIGGFVSTLSALNATTFSSARVAFVMGRDKMLPKQMEQVNNSHDTPHWSILYSGVIMLMVTIFIPIEDVASAADLLFIILFIQVNYASIKIRNKHKDNLFYGYMVPWLTIILTLAIISKFVLGLGLIYHSPIAFIGSVIWLALGIFFWFAYSKQNLEGDIGDAFDSYTIENIGKEDSN